MQALADTGRRTLAIAGGVAANSRIRRDFADACAQRGVRLCTPPLSLCGDNGAMIGSQGYYEYLAGSRAGQDLNAYATMEAPQQVQNFPFPAGFPQTGQITVLLSSLPCQTVCASACSSMFRCMRIPPTLPAVRGEKRCAGAKLSYIRVLRN